MDYFIAIAGSTQQLIAHLFSSDGTHLCYDVFTGIDINETDLQLQDAVIKGIQFRLARGINKSREELLANCSQLALAISGTDHRFDNRLLMGRLRNMGFHNIVSDDSFHFFSIAEAVYRGILDSEPGIVIRSGLGNSVFGVNKYGRSQVASGWGFIIGDLGSGFTLGKEVLNIIYKDIDGIATFEEKLIANEALRLKNVKDGLKLIEELNYNRLIYRYGNLTILRDVRDFSVSLFIQAKKGNRKANEILDRVNLHLFNLTCSVIEKLDMTDSEFKLIFHGSVFREHPSFARRLFNRLKNKFEKIKYIDQDKTYYSMGIGAAKLVLYSIHDECHKKLAFQNLEDSLSALDPEKCPELFWEPIYLENSKQ